MKIYQLHKKGGEWEDSYDYILGSYLRKERAEEEKTKAESEENKLIERSQKCAECPLTESFEDGFIDVNTLISENPNYCDESKLESGDFGISCENSYYHWGESYFEIEEVEVEE